MMNMSGQKHRHSHLKFFPPNPSVGNDKSIAALKDMQGLAPHFISVTASNNKFNIKRDDGSFGRLYPKWLGDSTIAHSYLPDQG